MKKSRVRVSDHAVLRYLERGLCVDIEGLRRRIGRRADRADAAGASAIVIDGLRYRVVEGCLVTVEPANVRRRRRRRIKISS